MRTRTKILLTIIAAVAYFMLVQRYGAPAPSGATPNSDLPKNLDKWYDGYNEEYFNNTLPKNVIIDWGEYDPNRMASTMKMTHNGQFHIAFNERYSRGDRNAHMTLLHEMCHIETWDEGVEDAEKTMHGPKWRACMLAIDAKGGFRRELIDGYRER